jgi:hypothetical protein
LGNISVAVSDALSKSKISQMVLQGGPASDDVELGFTHTQMVHTHHFILVCFLHLMKKLINTHLVLAIDDAGNESSKSIRFAYYPKNLIVLDKLNTLAVNKPLNLSSGRTSGCS